MGTSKGKMERNSYGGKKSKSKRNSKGGVQAVEREITVYKKTKNLGG